MHHYLRSIGFSKMTHEKDIDKLLKTCEKRGLSNARRYIDGSDQMWLEIRMPVSVQMGICISGYIGARGVFHRTAYYPYLWSDDITSTAKPGVYRRVDGGLFSAIIDDARVGMTLIYQLDNPFDYLHKCGEGNSVPGTVASKLTAFCTKGFVLLPSAGNNNGPRVRKPTDDKSGVFNGSPNSAAIDSDVNGDPSAAANGTAPDSIASNLEEFLKSCNADPSDVAPSNYNNSDQEARMSLIEAARNGQTDAIEQLALEEMNTIATLSKRLQSEDIYSIVSSVFMPQGVECDIYLVVGDILRIERVRNELSGEEIFDLTLNVNDMIIHVAINDADLEGEPAVGRRFKGRIWLQGRIEF